MNKIFVIIYMAFCYIVVGSCSGSQHSLSYYKSHLDEIKIPSSDSIITISNGKIMLSKDEGESGDYVNLYLQYYKNNKLQYYKRISRFFNSLCYDGVLEESEEYNVKGTQIKLKKRILKDENGNKVDSTVCQLPYRFPFKLTYILNE